MKEQTSSSNLFLRLVLGVLLLFSGPAVRADEVQNLTAVADAPITQDSPNLNDGLADDEVTSEDARNVRSLLRFDLSSIVATAAVKTSLLRLFLRAEPNTSRTHGVHRVTGSPQWTETSVTWNSRDGATNWTAPGGDFFATPADTQLTGTAPNVTITWTVRTDGAVTNIPQEWLDGTVLNRGLIVRDQSEDSAARECARYSSRERGAPEEPILEVHFLRDVESLSPTPGISKVTWTWSFPTGSVPTNYDGVLFAKKLGPAASFVFAPADGTTHTVGDDLGNGESVPINTTGFGTVSAVDENGAHSVVLPGTAYTYKAFTHDANIITGAATPVPPHYAFGLSGDATTLTGGGLNKNWSYLTGGTTLAPPGLDPGNTVVTGSNDFRVHSMSTATGERRYQPIAPLGTTGGAIQSRPPVIPSAFSSTGVDATYVGAGDGRVYAFNVLTGAMLWQSVVLSSGVGSGIQGGAAVQADAFSNASFTPSCAPCDLVIVGTRNTGLGSSTNNSVVALNGNTGAVVWTFTPGNLDIINSTPLVDFTNNVVWVSSRAGSGGTQPSLWKLNSVTGALIESFNLGDIDGSPTLNADGQQVYVVVNSGSLVAARTSIPACTFTTNPGTGAGVGFPLPISAGANADDIFFSTATTVNKVNFAYGAATCTGTFTTPATGWTNPAIATPSAPIFTPLPLTLFLYVGSSDGRLHKIDPTTGADLATRDVNLSATVGSPSFDVVLSRLYVGDTSGRIYAFDLF
ncbi:MAG: DNRLRE domain-containing protein [Terriglobia bacterium]